MKKYEAVIFDLDDTLYLEIEYVKSGLKEVAMYLSNILNEPDEDIYKELLILFKINKENIFNRYLQQKLINNKNILEYCIEIYRTHYPKIILSNEAKDVLEYLKYEKKYKLGLITDGRPEGQKNKIRALNLQKYFNYIIITDELGGIEFRKPNRLPYIKMINYLGVEPAKAVYVGDNPAKDFIGAKELGIFTIMVRNKESLYSQENFPEAYLADAIVENILELKEIL
ncbi:MAG: putative hydrolase of the superfamily [Thermosipho sp. (in: thermotogales)]|nr:putative hydrolase of the superfamily [Thermosipho sp. (in: thermotogales)]